MSEKEPIVIWSFCDAPNELKELSPHGGDEDWIAVIPPSYSGCYISWLECVHFGCCDISEHDHPLKPGYEVKIAAHA
jgi:hypothetical protein